MNRQDASQANMMVIPIFLVYNLVTWASTITIVNSIFMVKRLMGFSVIAYLVSGRVPVPTSTSRYVVVGLCPRCVHICVYMIFIAEY